MGMGAEGPSPSEVSAPLIPLSLGSEGRPGLGRSPRPSGQSALRPLTLEWLRPGHGDRLAQVLSTVRHLFRLADAHRSTAEARPAGL